MPRLLRISILLVAASWSAPGGAEPDAPAARAKAPVVARHLSAAEWNALADDAVLDLEGRKVTKRELRAEIDGKLRSQAALLDAVAQRARRRLEARKAELQRESEARIAASRAAVESVGKKLGTPAPADGSCAPVIEQFYGQVAPGGHIMMTGDCFGSPLGKLRVTGVFPGGGFDVVPTSWGIHQIYANVPDVGGAPDQAAVLTLTTPAGKKVQRQVTFWARRDVRMLSKSDVTSFCDAVGLVHDCTTPSGYAFRGAHAAMGANVGGKDLANLHLTNQWTITDCIFETQTSGATVQLKASDGVGPTGCKEGSDRVRAAFEFYLKPTYPLPAWESHALAVVIEGPIGLPYK